MESESTIETPHREGDCSPRACSAARELADCHEMLAQMASDEGEREDAQCEMEIASTIRRLVATLEDANSLCRSAMQIAERDEAETNWEAFRGRLSESLKRQHRVMYPEQNAEPTDQP